MSCVDEPRAQSVVYESRAVSPCFGVAGILTNSSESPDGSCGKDTIQASLAHLVTYQLDVVTVSSWCFVPRASAEACKKAEQQAKRKLMAQPEISHEPAEQILRREATRTDENIPGIIHVSHQLALLHGHDKVIFCKQCGAVNAGGTLRLLKSLCDGTGESRQKARPKLEQGLMPNEQVTADAKRAF